MTAHDRLDAPRYANSRWLKVANITRRMASSTRQRIEKLAMSIGWREHRGHEFRVTVSVAILLVISEITRHQRVRGLPVEREK